MSRSNSRRAARSDRRADFAARAGETASSESKIRRPSPRPWPAISAGPPKVCARRANSPAESEGLTRGHRVSAGRGVDPIRIGRDADACRFGRDARTDARSPWRAAEPARPNQAVAPARDRRATARKSRAAIGAARSRRTVLPPRRSRPRPPPAAFRVGDEVPQGAGEPLEVYVGRKLEKIGGGSQRRRVEPRGRRAKRATADGRGQRGWWARSRRRWAKDARRRAARQNPRDGAPARRRRSRRATPGAGAAPRRTADSGAKRIEQSEAGASEEGRVGAGADAWFLRRPRPRRKCSLQQWVGRRGTGCVQPARPAPRRDDRRRAARIAGAEFRHRRGLRDRIEPWPSITQGGALSSSSAPNPPRLSCKKHVR